MPRKKLPPKETLPTSVRLTPEASRLWEALAEKMGLSKAGALETILRSEAERRKIVLPPIAPEGGEA